MPSNEDITRHLDGAREDVIWVGDPEEVRPISLVEPDPSWPAVYEELAGRIRAVLGDRAVALEHVGSTSVPGLPAKPVIDIDLTVADNRDEAAYVPDLVTAGFALRIREPRWHEHRLLVAVSPAANLHVWGPDSPEAVRHVMFRDWLRAHPDDRARYAAAKREAARAATAAAEEVMSYNLRKQPVIRDILDRLFAAHGLR